MNLDKIFENFEYYEDHNDLSMTSDAYAELTDDIEELVKKFTGKEIMCPESDSLSHIRELFLNKLEELANNPAPATKEIFGFAQPVVEISPMLPKLAFHESNDQCILCNKELQNASDKESFYIHSCDGQIDTICHEEDDDHVENYDFGNMGHWKVGPECVKKLRGYLERQDVNPSHYIRKG